MKRIFFVLGLAALVAFTAVPSRAADEKAEPKKEQAASQPAAKKEEAPKQVTPGALDGKSFTGEIGAKGQKADPDTFIFKDGRFTSTACEKFGFKDAAYTTSGEGKNMRFRATTMNTSGAKIDWDGTVSGDKIEGKAVLNQPGKPAEDKMFKAKVTK
jgi:hypothetical protein